MKTQACAVVGTLGKPLCTSWTNFSLSTDSDAQMSGVAADNEEVELDALLLDSVGPGAATADGPSKARSPAAAALTHPQTSAAAAQAAAPHSSLARGLRAHRCAWICSCAKMCSMQQTPPLKGRPPQTLVRQRRRTQCEISLVLLVQASSCMTSLARLVQRPVHVWGCPHARWANAGSRVLLQCADHVRSTSGEHAV